MSARLVGVLSVAALLAVGCVSGASVGLVTDGESALEGSPGGSPSRDDLLAGELPVGELVADGFLDGAGVFAGSAGESGSEFPSASAGGGSGDSLVLVSVGVSSLTLGWGEDFAEGASGFRLRWRVRPFEEPGEGEGNEGGEPWSVVDLPASARSYTITGLAAGGRYVVRVSVLDSSGREVSSARGGFETLAPPPEALSVSASGHDAAVLRWSSPGWSPAGYVLQWRVRGEEFFVGRLRLPPGRVEQIVAGLQGGSRYVFRLTALTPHGWQSLPAQASLRTPPAPSGGLSLAVRVPPDCTTGEGRTREVLDFDLLEEVGGELYPPGSYITTDEELDALWNSPEVRRRVREGVESFTLKWEVSGGTPPYKLSFHGVEASGASGSAEVTCAREGVNLNNLADPDAQVVEEGPKTIVVTATDSAGAATTATAVVEIIKAIRQDEYGAVISSGSTHLSGYAYAQVPEGMQIVYEGLWEAFPASWVTAEDGFVTLRSAYRQVTDGPRATGVQVDATTGEEVERYVVMLTTINGRTEWRKQQNLELTPEENALWDQYFNSLSYVPPSTSAEVERMYEEVDRIYELLQEAADSLNEYYEEHGIDEKLEFPRPLPQGPAGPLEHRQE